MEESMSDDPMVRAVKQFVVNCAPYIREASDMKELEEAICHMEETDEHFHKYGFVRQLRSTIDEHMGHLIDDEIENHSIHPNDTTSGPDVVNRITNRVMQSNDYRGMTDILKEKIRLSVDYLESNFEQEMQPGSVRGTFRHSKYNEVFSDAGSSFCDSSLNQSAFMFMSSEQFSMIAEELDKKKTTETKVNALKKLMHTTTSDAQNCEAWARIKEGLQHGLGDQNVQLSDLCLKFIAKGFTTNNQCNKELYTALVEYLTMQFTSKSSVPKIKDGLDVKRAANTKIIKAFRLMNEFQQVVSQYWIRYPDKFLDDVLESTMSLLSMQHNSSTGSAAMSPGHFMALLDTRASWFVKWMHGHYSRAPIFKVLEKHKNIIENAVRSVYDYAMARRDSFDTRSDMSSSTSGIGTSATFNSSKPKRSQYKANELEFMYFVHSIYILGNTICYRNGRKFFPVKLAERDVNIDVSKLLVLLIQLITDCNGNVGSRSEYDPTKLVTSVIKNVCSTQQVCQMCMCKDEITDTLLHPVNQWLHEYLDIEFLKANEGTLLSVADILATIASFDCGRKHLLYGENRKVKSKSAPAYRIAEFAKRTLAAVKDQEGHYKAKIVIGNYVYLCRQLYNTCEGLQVLYPYDLHGAISYAWKEANREADNAATPTPSLEGGTARDADTSSQVVAYWEDILRDNLLNFAGTPKGLLLLQNTGAMNECVDYMYMRYEQKLQVSKCEKFGYGYMMSQVAATAPGMVALETSGFISAQIKAVWSGLEVTDDLPAYTGKAWPVVPIDKSAKKAFTNMVNLTSAFLAVYELLADRKLPSKKEYGIREVPNSLVDLFDRLVLVDTEPKFHSLFNYEQSHIFGLRLLSCMTCCLDTLLLLQTQYSFQEKFLKQQQENTTDDSTIILDGLSIERHYILVRTYLIGGPSERKFPPRMIPETGNFKIPMFTKYPPPKEYTLKSKSSPSKSDSDLARYLAETKKSGNNPAWLDKCKKVLCSVLTTKSDQAKGAVLQDLLEKCVDVCSDMPEDAIFPFIEYTGSESSLKNYKLTKIQQLGVKYAARYGIQLDILSNEKDAMDKLSQLIKQTSAYLQQQQRASAATSSHLRSMKTPSVGFDWFAATIFLIMGGNKDKAWKLLQKFSTMVSSAYLWMHRLHSSIPSKDRSTNDPKVQFPTHLMLSGVPPVFSSTCHNVEYLLQMEVPHVFSAFRMSGYSPAQICQQWIRQCFWNYLDWTQICHYICICILLGIDYQVYMCVAVLKSLKNDILQQTQKKDLIVFLKEEPIRGFRVGDHLEYMQQLESKYRQIILPEMQNISKA